MESNSSQNRSQSVNLKEIFTEEEISKLLCEDSGSYGDSKFLQFATNRRRTNTSPPKSPSSVRTSRVSNIIFSRSKLILKILEMTKQQLLIHKNLTLAKGITWLTSELSDSLLFKSDDVTLSKIKELKNENQDMKYIVSWLEEYSTIKLNQIAKEKLINNHMLHDTNHLSIKDVKSIIKTHTTTSPSKGQSTKTSPDVYSEAELLNINQEVIKDIDKPTFDIFKLDKEVGKENTLSVIGFYVFTTYGFYNLIKYSTFENFMRGITKGYIRANPYHSDLHAADITHTCMIYLKYGGIDTFAGFDIYNLCALFLSCIVHDFKHPGVTNGFLINTCNPLALRYNDKSVLENYHIAQTFKLINSNSCYNIFSELDKNEMLLIRKRMINCVLSTDMINHAKLYSFLKLSIEKYNIVKGENANKIFEPLDKVAKYDMEQTFLDLAIHSCDISNPTKPLEIYDQWADRVMSEFYLQGDKEKKLGLPVSFLCDRETTTKAQGQLGFIDGVVYPFFKTMVEIFPGLEFLIDNLKINKEEFRRRKEKEAEDKKSKFFNKIEDKK